jgi:hypothetical protein
MAHPPSPFSGIVGGRPFFRGMAERLPAPHRPALRSCPDSRGAGTAGRASGGSGLRLGAGNLGGHPGRLGQL